MYTIYRHIHTISKHSILWYGICRDIRYFIVYSMVCDIVDHMVCGKLWYVMMCGMVYDILIMFLLIIRHTVKRTFRPGDVSDYDISHWAFRTRTFRTGHFQSITFQTPIVGSITNSKTYKISQFSPTCFLRS